MSSPNNIDKKRKSKLRKTDIEIPVEVNDEHIDINQHENNNNANNSLNDDLRSYNDESFSTPKKESSSISSSSCDNDDIKHTSKKQKIIKETNSSNLIIQNEAANENKSSNDNLKTAGTINDNDEPLIDLDTHFQTTAESESVSSKNKMNNYTIVDIILIFTKTVFGPMLAGATLSNFFGGRHYLTDSINCCSKLMYWTYIQQILNDTTIVSKNSDVSYLFHKNNRPINLLTYLPKVENKYYAENFKETIKKLTAHFDGRPDPSNEGKVFKFNYLQEFHLNTNDRITTFSKLCKKTMVLPDKFTLAHQSIMELAGELPNTNHNEYN
jgi:hypothetical protein